MKVTVTSSIPEASAKGVNGAKAGLTIAAEHVLTASRARVPIEEGTLERSGKVTKSDNGLEAAVSYGDGGTGTYVKKAERGEGYSGTFDLGDVAVVQHENMEYRHDAGRTAKYLEGPLIEESRTVGKLIAASTRRALR